MRLVEILRILSVVGSLACPQLDTQPLDGSVGRLVNTQRWAHSLFGERSAISRDWISRGIVLSAERERC
jgi:hypothetical protein